MNPEKNGLAVDAEKGAGTPPAVDEVVPSENDILPHRARSFWKKLSQWGVEIRGIVPIPTEERTNSRYINIFSIWLAMSVNTLPISTGMVGTLSYGLSLRDSALVILFFSFLTILPAAYFCTFGPKTGLRQMIQARFTFGLYGIYVPIFLNMATVTGFILIGCIIGGQTLSAISDGNLSVNVGIVILGILTLLLSFCGFNIIHYFERWSWIPSLIAIIIATSCGGKDLSKQVVTEAPTPSTVISFGALIAGFFLPYAGLASDFSTYMRPDGPSWRIFWYTYAGIFVPSVLLMTLGAAIGGAVHNVPSWSDGYDRDSVGGVLAAMLGSAGGFGKFVVFLIAMSPLGNTAASLYSVSLNIQMLVPILTRVPRALLAIGVTAVVIPVSIKAAVSFFNSLENFIGIIGYWSGAFVAAVLMEHMVIRKRDFSSYKQASWNVARELPSGTAALAAGISSFGMVIPCMYENWYIGPIAKTTGDIGFEVAFCITSILYIPLRYLEIRVRGRL
ncbi:hypothetical protein B7494_g2368 [Chlorociboria aeruginascens]|nr:hypothetical protein B7494_g2368 [Chlorociboria aeruginascens]